MVGFVGITGLAGAGKTTAVSELSKLTGGRILYLGQTVIEEVRARGLAETRENERRVRLDLRREKGPAALALPHAAEVENCIQNNKPVFVDAIFTQAEFEFLSRGLPSGASRLLAIDASFAVRCVRLASREKRPFNTDELSERDQTELRGLRTDVVIQAAGYTIRNEGTLGEYYLALAEFVSSCG